MSDNNKVVTVLIADDNREQCERIKSLTEIQNDMKVVGIAHNGIEAYSKILEHKPDIAIIDLIMPGLDGLGILEKLYVESPNEVLTKSIVLSPMQDEGIAKRSTELGANYYMLKPYNSESLLKRVRDLTFGETPCSNLNKISTHPYNREIIGLQHYVAKLITKIGIPANMRGYRYIIDAVIFCVKDSELIHHVTKGLYPDIAKKHDTTISRVEGGIRHAIHVAWKRNDKNIMDKMLNHDMKENKNKIGEMLINSIKENKNKPSNSEFVALIVEKIKIICAYDNSEILC